MFTLRDKQKSILTKKFLSNILEIKTYERLDNKFYLKITISFGNEFIENFEYRYEYMDDVCKDKECIVKYLNTDSWSE